MERIKRLEVSNLITPPVLVPSETPLSKVVGILKELSVYQAFVEEKGKIKIVTMRDLLKASNLITSKASSVGTFLPKLSRRSTVGEAARLMMEYRIRALPVVEDGEFVGEVQDLSIINASRRSDFSKVEVKSIMTGNAVTINTDDLASKARRLMMRRRIDHLPVLAMNKLCGILMSSHIVMNMVQATETIGRSEIISEEQRKLEFPVKYLADTNPLTCKSDDSISLVFDEMSKLRTTYSIVILWEEVQGIVTYRDYMKLLAEQLKIGETPIYIIGLPEDPFEAELAKNKFTNAVKLLKRPFPFIEEAKAVISTFADGTKGRRRYEVNATIITPKKIFSYSEMGWDLPKVFDRIANKLKKMMEARPSKRVLKEEKA